MCASRATAQPDYDYGYANNPDIETLTRGPVHEAFAEPISYNPEPGPLAPTAPPEPIPETPPGYRPAGANISWIPGYWSWDDEYNDYIWISGIWRDIPPGREWIAGYWIDSHNGFRWIPGYWADTYRTQTRYLPEPPLSVESGPNYATAPSPDYTWAAGSWVWQDRSYAWRPGQWIQGRPDWIWVPAHYVWSPRGYVFVDGYWDYDIDRRGVLFAPTRFRRTIYRQPQFRFSPNIVIDLRTFTDHLFLRPSHYHYYFGDYFDSRYTNRGYRPWFTAARSRKVYDPIYSHRRWQNRNDRDWDNRLRRDFDYRRNNPKARPPRTWGNQRDYMRNRNRDRDNKQPNLIRTIGKTLGQVVRRKHDRHDFKPIDNDQRAKQGGLRGIIESVRDQRRAAEKRTDGKPDERYRKRTVPAHEPRQKSGIVSKPIDQLGKSHRPPQQPKSPAVDRKIEARKRRVIKRKNDDKKRDHDRKRDDDKKRGRKRD